MLVRWENRMIHLETRRHRFTMPLYCCLLAAVLASCAEENSSTSLMQTAKDTVTGVCKDALSAITAPLEDLNLKRQPIPDELQDCSLNPYAMPLPPLCPNITDELSRLDKVLGPDMEAKPLPWLESPKGKKYYVEQGTDMARRQAVGIVSSKANIIPFRGAVRHVTGAEKHSKEVARAYEAGKLRRAFLKGLQIASNCANRF